MEQQKQPTKEELVKGITELVKQAENNFDTQMQQFKKLAVLISKYADKNPNLFTQDVIAEIQSITCYGSLAFCCGTSKPCMFRDIALLILGVKYADFNKKTEWIAELLEGRLTPEDREKRKELTEQQKEKIKKLDTKELKKQKTIVAEGKEDLGLELEKKTTKSRTAKEKKENEG